MACDVFISYSSSDKLVADAVCARLEEKRIRCWIAPRDIRPGRVWAEAITEAMSECRIALLILSGNSNSSNQVAREVDLAARNGLTIVPFRIENTQPSKSLEYYLSNIHWLDALTEPREKEIEILCQYIQGILSNDKSYIAGRQAAEPVEYQEEVDTVNSNGIISSQGSRKRLPKWALVSGIMLIFALVVGGLLAFNHMPAQSPGEAVKDVATKYLIAAGDLDYRNTKEQPGLEYTTEQFKNELKDQTAVLLDNITKNQQTQRVVDVNLSDPNSVSGETASVKYEYTIMGNDKSNNDFRRKESGILYLQLVNGHWLVNANKIETPMDVRTIVFDGGKDESDMLRGKINAFAGGYPTDDVLIKLIPQATVVILLDRPGSPVRPPAVEQLFTGMFNKDANYLNVKNKDGKILVIVHAESKDKLLSILNKIQASDFNGDKYVTY